MHSLPDNPWWKQYIRIALPMVRSPRTIISMNQSTEARQITKEPRAAVPAGPKVGLLRGMQWLRFSHLTDRRAIRSSACRTRAECR